MVKNLLNESIVFVKSAASWEQAIKMSCNPMLKQGIIEEKYIDSIIESVNKNGSYFVLVPGIALPHASNSEGVNKNGVSILKLDEPVLFPDNKEVNVLISLASTDGDSHMEIFSSLANILIDEELRKILIHSRTKEEILEIL